MLGTLAQARLPDRSLALHSVVGAGERNGPWKAGPEPGEGMPLILPERSLISQPCTAEPTIPLSPLAQVSRADNVQAGASHCSPILAHPQKARQSPEIPRIYHPYKSSWLTRPMVSAVPLVPILTADPEPSITHQPPATQEILSPKSPSQEAGPCLEIWPPPETLLVPVPGG